MAVTDNPGDKDADTSEDDEESARRSKHISGDDLGDSFSNDVKSKPKVGWIDEVLRKGNTSNLESEAGTSYGESEDDDDEGSEEGSDNNYDKDEQSQSLKDWEQSDDENIGTNFEDDEEAASEDEITRKKMKELVDIVDQKKPSESRGEQNIGSSIREAITNLKEDFHQHEQIMEAIRQIQTFNAISVAAENRKKMQFWQIKNH